MKDNKNDELDGSKADKANQKPAEVSKKKGKPGSDTKDSEQLDEEMTQEESTEETTGKKNSKDSRLQQGERRSGNQNIRRGNL